MKTKTRSAKSRRAFLGRAGATLTGAFTFAAAEAASVKSVAQQDAQQVIRQLHQDYVRHVSHGALEQVPALFSPNARVRFNGGVFVGQDRGIRRLYREHFGRQLRSEPVHVLLLDHPQTQDFIAVSQDGASARARFHCLVQVQSSIESALTIVEMARQQGQGAAAWWEVGCFDNSYARLAEGWRITELRYRPLPAPDQMTHGLRTRPAAVPLFATLYPENPVGPDHLDSDLG
jgi:hypothetical protein